MRLLQKFGFRESRYERPQDTWVCGHLADGHPCTLGPDARGRCRTTAACHPRFEDGRWECRRSPQDGGPCDTGPYPDGRCAVALPPCQPKLSLRAKRRRATRWAAALAAGLVVVILGASQTATWLMPGTLSASHATLDDCSSCHAGIEAGPLGFLHSFDTQSGPEANARLCLSCHEVGEAPFSAHTRPADDLRRLSEAARADAVDESWIHRVALLTPATGSKSESPQVFCATCHQEHRDGEDLTQISNARCQTCHVAKFGSFADSHPPFEAYPLDRRSRIIFDHKSHFTKHFPDTKAAAAAGGSPAADAPDTCTSCHEPGADRRYMEVRSYETMCQSCHDGDIIGTTRASGPKGIDFLAVPGLDVLTLQEQGIDIGQWPRRAEAPVTPFLRLFLSLQEDGAAVARAKNLDRLRDLDLLDLREADAEDLALVERLAWSVKSLLVRLEDEKLSQAVAIADPGTGTPAGREAMAVLTGLLPHDVIQAANDTWFPDLREDLRRHALGEPTASFQPPPSADAQPQETELTVDEEPSLSEASDDILASEPGSDADILGQDEEPGDDILGGSSTGDDILGELSEDGDDILAGNGETDGSILGEGLDPGDTPDLAGGPDLGTAGEAGEDILAAPPQDDILGMASEDAPGGDPAPDSILGGGDILAGDASDPLLGGDADTADPLLQADSAGASADDDAAADAAPFDPEAWAEFGGWYRQDFALRYRPVGHADRFLRAWLDFAGHAYETDMQPLLAPIFEQLSPESAVGRCTKCHSIDDEDGARHVKWRGFATRRVVDRFTVFSHEPHLSAVGEEGCTACHSLTPGGSGDFLRTYSRFDPSVFTAVFADMDKALCAGCHTDGMAGEDCTLCHSYHATEFARPLVQTKLP